LYGVPQTPTTARCARELRKRSGEPLCPGDRIELVAELGQAGRGLVVVIGAERDDEHVRLVGSRIGRDATCFGIDRRHRLAQKSHSRLGKG
jgi:hypothetical protein